jgi:hypothetical protein
MKNLRTLTIFCQHGGERFGALVGFELLKRGCAVEIGNPRAFLKGTRFFETDTRKTMFISEGESYDRHQFDRITRECDKYDLVIDIHTTTANVGKVAILNEGDDELINVALKLGYTNIAIMPKSIFQNTLSGNTKAKVISLEHGIDYRQDEISAVELAERIRALNDTQMTIGTVEVYHIKGTIPLNFQEAGLQNYKFNGKIDGYPFIVGESSYKTHAGFFADRKETVIIEDSND